jgi:pimeloyl-ACP methyl ester carboxylesterase
MAEIAAMTTGTRHGKFIAGDGATIEYFTHGDPSSPALMLSPAFTGSALLYVEKFGKALPDYHVVGVQLRAHGQGGGCTFHELTYCTQAQSPEAGTYRGLRMSRLAADLRETRLHLGLGKVAMMGHSMGMNVVAEYISDFGTQDIAGLFVYDQSPKNLADGVDPENATFPQDVATYPMDQFNQLIASFQYYDPSGGYLNVPSSVRTMLGGSSGDPVFNPVTQSPAFVLTEQTWREWASFADTMNGKALSLLFWSTMTSDYTDVYRVVSESGMPVLVYGGESSIVPLEAMRWVHQQVPGSELFVFDKWVGVHAAFLNPPPSGNDFMRNVQSFLDRRVRPRFLI